MFKSNKGAVNLTILIVSIVAGVLIIALIAGIIIWKVVGEEESGKKSRDKEKMVDGYIDCGVSDLFLNPTHMDMFNADFDEDDVMVCMGKNIKNNCKDSTSLIKTDDFDITYQASGTSKDDCKIRIEIYDEGALGYVECPLSGLISLPDISYDYTEFKEKFSKGSGNYAGGLFMMIFDVIDKDWDIGREILGCTSNID